LLEILTRSETRRRGKFSITRYRKLLLQLGFRERATADLIDISRDFGTPKRRELAARELAVLNLESDRPSELLSALDNFEFALSTKGNLAYKRATTILSFEALIRLGEAGRAREFLLNHVQHDPYLDFYLGLANCEPDTSAKVTLINEALRGTGLLDIALQDVPAFSTYDRLTSGAATDDQAGRALITVIMPAYNSAAFISTAIGSLLAQTWWNFELLVVDDCSTDSTALVVSEWVERDPRVRLIHARDNGGPYVARNLALREAAGTFITCNDADDWSHPQKLALQARHLLENPQIISNDSQQVRTTEDLHFYRRGQASWYTFRNMSSFMFRREEVSREIGFWDCVRFGADSEFITRINTVFGQGAVISLQTGPVSFQRQSAGSLTAHSAFGYNGFHMGARLEYARQQAYFHQTAVELKYSFPQAKRAFPVPEPMWPRREVKAGARRFYDVVIAADLRISDETSWALVAEVEAQAAAGLRTGLVQLSRYDVAVDAPMPDHIRRLLDHDRTDVIVYGEKIECNLAIVRCTAVLRDEQVYFPDIDAKVVVIVAGSLTVFNDTTYATLADAVLVANRRAEQYFQKGVLWCAETPLLRETLQAYRRPEGQKIAVADHCWEPILCSRNWYRPQQRTARERSTVGYHATRGLTTNPEAPYRLTSIYSETDKFERQVLGAPQISANAAQSVPDIWKLVQSDEMRVAEFLEQLDVFLCYDPKVGRDTMRHLVFEAMAAGVPVVLDPAWKAEFGDAAAYATPENALALAFQLLEISENYEKQQSEGISYIGKTFSQKAYLDRIEELRKIGANVSPGFRKRLISGLDAIVRERMFRKPQG
jgi:glycosyltransferase involved in cell wall biosynthesis